MLQKKPPLRKKKNLIRALWQFLNVESRNSDNKKERVLIENRRKSDSSEGTRREREIRRNRNVRRTRKYRRRDNHFF